MAVLNRGRTNNNNTMRYEALKRAQEMRSNSRNSRIRQGYNHGSFVNSAHYPHNTVSKTDTAAVTPKHEHIQEKPHETEHNKTKTLNMNDKIGDKISDKISGILSGLTSRQLDSDILTVIALMIFLIYEGADIKIVIALAYVLL